MLQMHSTAADWISLLAWRGRPYWEISPRISHRSASRFNQREVARALRAARLAGERPERVEIDPWRISVIIAKDGEGAAGAVWGHGA